MAILFALTSCASKPVANNLEVFSGDHKTSLLYTESTDKMIRFADIINHYQDSDDHSPSETPDYIVKVQPSDRNNGSIEYKFWLKEGKVIFLPPQLFKDPVKLGVSDRPVEEFQTLLKKD